MVSYRDALWSARQQFSAVGHQSAALDARQLLLAVSGFDAAALITQDQNEMPAAALAQFEAFCARRVQGEPIARIIGHKEFYGRDFSLNADTLVPRPETELLVDIALEKLKPNHRVLDLGTGSGAILLSLLAERADISGVGIDLSEAALDAAQQNADALSVADRARFFVSDWFGALGGQKFDLIVANPPYIGEDERDQMNKEALDFDPPLALFAPEEGLYAYRKICANVIEHLHPNGWVMFEIGYRQADPVQQLCRACGLTHIEVRQDLSELDRVVIGQRK